MTPHGEDIVKALEIILDTIKNGSQVRKSTDTVGGLDAWRHNNNEVYYDGAGYVVGLLQGQIHNLGKPGDPNIHVRFEMHEIFPPRKGFGGIADIKEG